MTSFLNLQALVGEQLSNSDTNNSAGGIIHKVLDPLTIHFDPLWLLRNTKGLDLCPLDFPNVALALAITLEHAILVLTGPSQLQRALLDRDTIVKTRQPTRTLPLHLFVREEIVGPVIESTAVEFSSRTGYVARSEEEL
jgi:hypothetical protein